MLIDDAIQKVNLLANGKGTSLGVDSTKYTKILQLINMYKDVWAREPGVVWESLRSWENMGTVTATDSFELPDTVLSGQAIISDQEGDFVRVVWSGGTQESQFTIVKDGRMYRNGSSVSTINNFTCARRGENLVFSTAFTSSDNEYGGTIYLPVYTTPDDIVSSTVSASSELIIDDPMWVIFMAAAEYVRNDITKQNQYANLVAQATNCMMTMKENNTAQQEDVYVPGQLGSAMGETW